MRRILVAGILFTIVLSAAAQTPAETQALETETRAALRSFRQHLDAAGCTGSLLRALSAPDAEDVAKKAIDFEALGFGAGYAAVINLSDDTRVEEAEVVNGIVRVTKDNDAQFGPVLEMHKFIWSLRSETLVKYDGKWVVASEVEDKCVADLPVRKVPLIGMGPLVTVRVGGNEVVQSFGAGIEFAFRTAESDKSLNLGVAYVVDPSVRILGDGLVEGKALPAGETQIRYRTTNQYGLMVLFSVGW